ncbi:hypothetical protein WMY93_006434 [Mugilogobius chulae]|uniref:Ig-like domain-containing protein n=1 Tax=Mugilogobius chulae TaxID=88201 RepID=A0AAW0PVJ1_9GOBI
MIGILLISGFVRALVSASLTDVEVTPGQNITLFCDCPLGTGTFIVWLRNCSHVNQPTLVLSLRKAYSPYVPNSELMSPLPRFQFVKNVSSNSYNLQIANITESDQGLYFCATETRNVKEVNGSLPGYVYRYGKIATRIKISSKMIDLEPKVNVSWVVILLPLAVILFSNVCFILLYHLYQKHGSTFHTQLHQDKDHFSTQ